MEKLWRNRIKLGLIFATVILMIAICVLIVTLSNNQVTVDIYSSVTRRDNYWEAWIDSREKLAKWGLWKHGNEVNFSNKTMILITESWAEGHIEIHFDNHDDDAVEIVSPYWDFKKVDDYSWNFSVNPGYCTIHHFEIKNNSRSNYTLCVKLVREPDPFYNEQHPPIEWRFEVVI